MDVIQDPSLFCNHYQDNTLPTIVIFDSGVGGLSIYKEVFHALPHVNYVYVFDNVAFPYGEQPDSIILERVNSIIHAMTLRYKVTLAVIACNTASTLTLPSLRARFTFPIVGVVPAIKPAATMTRNGIIGLLATPATIRREYTLDLIKRYAKEHEIVVLGSTELVKWTEIKLRGEKVPLTEIKRILAPWNNLNKLPDIIVLGCTHFPLLKEELLAVLSKEIQFIDSGIAIAQRAVTLLNEITNNISYNTPSRRHAFCLSLTQNVIDLFPAFNRYGFSNIDTLSI